MPSLVRSIVCANLIRLLLPNDGPRPHLLLPPSPVKHVLPSPCLRRPQAECRLSACLAPTPSTLVLWSFRPRCLLLMRIEVLAGHRMAAERAITAATRVVPGFGLVLQPLFELLRGPLIRRPLVDGRGYTHDRLYSMERSKYNNKMIKSKCCGGKR